MKSKKLTIAVDFDGTCVTHAYPAIGEDIGAIPILKRLAANGHKLILYTMRDKFELEEARNWFMKNEIPLYGVQLNPSQRNWTTSPKCYANLYIDDSALGCPLVYPEGARPYVDWFEVEQLLMLEELI